MQEAESMHTLVFLLPSHVNTQFQTNFLLTCFILFSNSRLFRRQLKFSGGLLITLFQDNLGFWNQGKPNRDLHISNHRDLKSPLTLAMSDVFSASLAPEMKCHDTVQCQELTDLWLSALPLTIKQAWNFYLLQELVS